MHKRWIIVLLVATALVLSFLLLRGDNLRSVASLLDDLTHKEFYVALVNPDIYYIKVVEGNRKEEIASLLQKKLAWNDTQVKEFLGEPKNEGTYFPAPYLFNRNATGSDVRDAMNKKFETNTKDLSALLKKGAVIDLEKTLTIASIIQREAAGKSDMKIISGVIWNRLFSGMTLDIDATLQYAKGSSQIGWWPRVLPKDKQIASPYNTYKNRGLPPAPISNPGLAAIEAALNPEDTDCLFYFHKNRKIYCSATYQEHQKKIDAYLK